MKLRVLATSGILAVGLSGTALAQTAPTTASPPSAATRAVFAERGATFALNGAYHAIADAEARGGSTYLDAAKAHYRGALARLARHDAGAAAEAMAAIALARASIAAHPQTLPHDIPAPPQLAAVPMMPRPGAGELHGGNARPGMMRPGPMVAGDMHGAEHGDRMHGGMQHRGHGMAHFDAAHLAADVKLANSAETRDLAQKALDADVARTHAAFNGNRDEAMRDGRLADSLAMAVHSLAMADHPPAMMHRMRKSATVGMEDTNADGD